MTLLWHSLLQNLAIFFNILPSVEVCPTLCPFKSAPLLHPPNPSLHHLTAPVFWLVECSGALASYWSRDALCWSPCLGGKKGDKREGSMVQSTLQGRRGHIMECSALSFNFSPLRFQMNQYQQVRLRTWVRTDKMRELLLAFSIATSTMEVIRLTIVKMTDPWGLKKKTKILADLFPGFHQLVRVWHLVE